MGGLLCLAISAVLLARGAPAIARVVALVASPFVLFLALYGALAELEEVVGWAAIEPRAYEVDIICSWGAAAISDGCIGRANVTFGLRLTSAADASTSF